MKYNLFNQDILVIADTQIDENTPLHHLYALSKYIWVHKPNYIVHIGDHWDFPSLSSYASALESEGKRYGRRVSATFTYRFNRKKNERDRMPGS